MPRPKYVKIGYWAADAVDLTDSSEVESLTTSKCTPHCEGDQYMDMDKDVSTIFGNFELCLDHACSIGVVCSGGGDFYSFIWSHVNCWSCAA